MSNFELKFRNGVLRYRLRDHPVVHTWSRLAEWYYQNDDYQREQLNQNFDVSEYQWECESLLRLGADLLEEYPRMFDEKFKKVVWQPIYTRENLNYLHSEYERIRAYAIPVSLPEAFNDQIHVCERFHVSDGHIRSLIAERPRIRTRFIHKEWGSSAPWKLNYRPEDQELFEAPVSGRLYMTYCEVGKPPFSAYRDRDTVQPVPWKSYGPAFYITFQNWQGNEDFDAAGRWLAETHGPGLYWMGEPCLGELVGTSVVDAYEMVRKDFMIREMKWSSYEI